MMAPDHAVLLEYCSGPLYLSKCITENSLKKAERIIKEKWLNKRGLFCLKKQ